MATTVMSWPDDNVSADLLGSPFLSGIHLPHCQTNILSPLRIRNST